MPTERTIDVEYLARVEGEGSLKAVVRDGTVELVEFGIFEPPRFFEAFLRGRPYSDAPDITARICGICPVAYQMSSCHAMERAFGATVGEPWRSLRRLLYCGEWIESHVLHVFLLHAPDFLGYESAIHMAADHREAVEKALRLKKIGNEIVTVLGGREIHPINVRVGGFYSLARRRDLEAVPLDEALDLARWMVAFTASLPMPDVELDFDFVSLRHPDEYPLNEGRIVSTSGIDVANDEWDRAFVEEHVERSNALHSRTVDGGVYHVGPLARYAHNADRLSEEARRAGADTGLPAVVRNPFRSIVVRAVETVHAVGEAIRIADAYDDTVDPFVPIAPVAGTGAAGTEAPRGLLWHRYEVDGEGRITEARIVPPTAQNQLTMEADVRAVLEANLSLPDDELQWRLEQTIRNYDPCISCATHFLRLEIDRG
ncbi:MAG TPA: Ni/Fe hydrogenase subunit alpha [Acidimicrobiia bacterium]|nr:Ni/Fe hydrogenase subunit alpha [Acidimicrobiia bacterium]